MEKVIFVKVESLGLTKEDQAEHRDQFRQFLAKLFVAPVFVFVFVDQRQCPSLVGYDGVLAVQNMMLTAYALGYETSYQTTIFPKKLIKDQLSIPDDRRFIYAVPVGKPVSTPEVPEKKPLDTFIWEGRAHL